MSVSTTPAAPVLEGPVPATPVSMPFRFAANRESSLFVDLPALGYVEEEFFLRGTADACAPDDGGHGDGAANGRGRVLESAIPYATRVLVRRPASAEAFSGTVHLEPFHILLEDTPAWSNAWGYITRNGDAWVGVTVNSGATPPSGGSLAGGLAKMQEFDPGRYGSLGLHTFENVAPATNANGGVDQVQLRARMALATAQGHGIVSDLAQLLRNSEAGDRLLPGFSVERIVAGGWSQTGLFWRNYIDHGHHGRRPDDQGPLIDGYVICVAPGPASKPADAVVVNILSEAEVTGFLGNGIAVDDDTDAPRYRGYEIPGTFHHWHLTPAPPETPTGPAATNTTLAVPEDGHAVHNHHPWVMFVHAVLHNLELWLREGTPMPRAERVQRDPGAPDGVVRDEAGNVAGGVRSPWTDVPTAVFVPRCTCNMVTGAMKPFAPAEVARRYGDEAGVRAARVRSVRSLVEGRWLLPEDAAVLEADPSL